MNRDPVDQFVTIWGEVGSHSDCYGLRRLAWEPDLVLDVGANVGTLAHWAGLLFPNAAIRCLEPDPVSFAALERFTARMKNVTLQLAGIGNGPLWKAGPATSSGGNAVYVSEILGYTSEELEGNDWYQRSDVPSVRLREWALPITDKTLLKIDAEGAENSLLDHWPKELEFLRKIAYLAVEIHYFAATPSGVIEVRGRTDKALEALEDTHVCRREGPIFMAMRKDMPGADKFA